MPPPPYALPQQHSPSISTRPPPPNFFVDENSDLAVILTLVCPRTGRRRGRAPTFSGHHGGVCSMEASVPKSPKHASLWSHPASLGTHKKPRPVSTEVLGAILAICLALEMASEDHGFTLLSSHNGLMMKFLKSLHAINHCTQRLEPIHWKRLAHYLLSTVLLLRTDLCCLQIGIVRRTSLSRCLAAWCSNSSAARSSP